MRTYITLDDSLATFGTYTVAAGINDNGQIVGAFDDNGYVKGFLYSNGTYKLMRHASARYQSFLLILATLIGIYIPGAALAQNSTVGSGSGIVVSSSGEILTNNHVVDDCLEITVQLPNRGKEVAALVARDKENDLAVIRIKSSPPSVAVFREGTPLRIGEQVIALGYPLSGILASTVNLSVGVVSALAGLGDDSRYFQISAPVQPGNSGGPLLDASGHLAGIVTSKLDAIRAAREYGDIPQNVNFALKADVARAFLESRGFKYETGHSDQQLGAADIGDIAKLYTVRVDCKYAAQALNKPQPGPIPGRPNPPTLLESSILSRWAVDASLNCGIPSKSYSLNLNNGNVVWRDGTGKIDVEAVVFSAETEFRTITMSSVHPSGAGQSPGTTWTYSKTGIDLMSVKPSGRNAFLLARCPS